MAVANILVFWGRQHHAEKLVAVCQQLENMGHTVALLVCDNSINIDPSTEFVYNFTSNFIHLNDFALADSHGAETDIQHILYETVDSALPLISPFFYIQGVIESARNVQNFQNILNRISPDGVIVLHSNNFFAKPLLWAAKKRDIHTFSFQEGMIRYRDQETLNKQATAFEFIDTLFTWFQHDKQVYVQAGATEDSVIPVGPVHMDWAVVSPVRNQTKQARMAYYLPLLSEFRGSWQGDLSRLRNFASMHNVTISAKFHPFDYYVLDEAKKVFDGPLTSIYEGNPLSLMLQSDVVATGHSTTRLEAMILNKPIIELDFGNLGILEPYHEQGMAFSATNEEELLEAIQNRTKYLPAVARFRASIKSLTDGNAATRAAQKITEILS